jgi:tRNA pseudouridine55 synthase
MRTILDTHRIGHTGTLDPTATGLLLVGVGHATRLFPYLPLEPKQYEFGISFGKATDTMDDTGKVIEEGGSIPDAVSLAKVIASFVGKIRQRPPTFSAIKVDGVRSYRRARKEEQFILPERTVTIHHIEMVEFDRAAGRATLSVSCSSGTYVRTLADDIGRALKTYAHTWFIRRTALGPYTLDNSVTIDVLERKKESAMIPIADVLASAPCYPLQPAEEALIRFGRDIEIPAARGVPRLFALDSKQDLAAILEYADNNVYHPVKVFGSA